MRATQTQTGKIIPALQNKPSLNWYLLEIMKEFLELIKRRQVSMAALPLTPDAIIQYGLVKGWKPDLEFFFRCISALDDEYMEHHAEKREAQIAAEKAKQKSTPSRTPRRR